MRYAKHLRLTLPLIVLGALLAAGLLFPVGSTTEAAEPATGISATGEGPPAQAAQGPGAWSAGPIYPLLGTVAARDLPRAPDWQPGDPIKEIPRRHLVRTELEHTPAPRGFGMDPLAELQARTPVVEDRTFSSSTLNFAGLGWQNLNPPDPVGAVGRDYYIQMTNGSSGARFAIYNKSDGSVALGATLLSSLIGIASNCKSGLGDPIVLYDHLAERWLMTEFNSVGNELCVYMSWTGDPTGAWYLYIVPKPNFPDYPKYSVWPDAYYVSTNEGTGPAVYAYRRDRMLNASGIVTQRFTATPLNGFGFQALTPADLDGDRTPLPGEPGIFMRHNDDESHLPIGPYAPWDYLDMWEFHVDWANHPAGHSFNQLPSVQTTEFDSDLCGLTSFSCFAQPSGGVGLDPLREVIMWRLQYRNFGLYETLVGNFVTDVNGFDRGGIRWFELRRQRPGVGSWTLYQEGTYSTAATADRWMGSIAMDGGGNILIGHNYVSTSLHASLANVGRLATDSLGVMTKSAIVAGGGGVNGSYRYGDYNAMTVDPVDDCTFWFTGEYNPTSSWGTRVATYRFPQCPFELETIVMDEEAEPEGGKQ